MNLFSQKVFFFFPRCHDVTSAMTTTAANPTGLIEIGSYVVLCKDKLEYMDVSHRMSAVPIRTSSSINIGYLVVTFFSWFHVSLSMTSL